jgi:hypothetical protein
MTARYTAFMAGDVRAAGLRVAYEAAPGEPVEADARYVGERALLVMTEQPAPVGRRVALTLSLPGEPQKRAAVGLVLSANMPSGGAPGGMRIQLVDIDEGTAQALARLGGSGERTDPGVGGGRAPSRERTVLGVAPDASGSAIPSPVVLVAPMRERTVVGIAPPPRRPLPKEISVQDLPAPEGWDVAALTPEAAVEPAEEMPPVPDVPRRSRRWIWILIVAVVGALAAAGYARLSELLPVVQGTWRWVHSWLIDLGARLRR